MDAKTIARHLTARGHRGLARKLTETHASELGPEDAEDVLKAINEAQDFLKRAAKEAGRKDGPTTETVTGDLAGALSQVGAALGFAGRWQIDNEVRKLARKAAGR